MRSILTHRLSVRFLTCSLAFSTIAGAFVSSEVPAAAQQQRVTMSGKVVDQDGFTMPGVGITVKGKSGTGTVTDADGNYSITCDRNDILVYQFMGFKTLEMVAGNVDKVTVTSWTGPPFPAGTGMCAPSNSSM